MPSHVGRLLAVALVLLLPACTGDGDTGPQEVKWDRDACERCRMVLSDRNHSAQVRWFPAGKKRTKVHLFDDIGCAIIWLDDKPWKDALTTEIWVTDHRTGAWINARKAIYVKGERTPMEYGLGAQREPVADGLDFEQAKRHVHEVEERFNTHGTHLLQRLKEQVKRRAEMK